jgi:hypothetical protein
MDPADAPPDLGAWRPETTHPAGTDTGLPRELEAALDAIGVGALGR